jgi:3-hydroxyisobutyrate dehydrogenase-like beta-hydroxyacid dehydrogenase
MTATLSSQETQMELKVSLLGLGSMGTMLGRTLAAAGHELTVWNRGAARAEPFRDLCAVAASPLEACLAGDIVITCLSSYDATYEVLDDPQVKAALAGKTLVQLSTATPETARAFGAWAQAGGIDHLDGKIAVVPAQIGQEMTVIFYAGSKTVFARCEPVLQCLAGRTTYIGEALDGAVLGDFAFLSVYFAGIIGVLHGAAFCKATGMDIPQYFDLTKCFLHEIGQRVGSFQEMILAKDYGDVQSSLKTDTAGAVLLRDTAVKAGLNKLFGQSVVDILQDGVDRGFGAMDTAALVECFLKP